MSVVSVKICGITNSEDALWAANYGADFIGLNFCQESPRKVSLENAREIASGSPPFIKIVGVFKNPVLKDLEKAVAKVSLAVLQLHGEESPELCGEIKTKFQKPVWKALQVAGQESLEKISAYAGAVDAVLLDGFSPVASGGTGTSFDWSLAVKAKEAGVPIILAGGLNPENVKGAIREVYPFCVDVASGVEKEGHPRRKDKNKLQQFISNAKGKIK